MNVCIVGYGSIGPVHAKSVCDIPGVKVYAVCDINQENAKKCEKEFGAKIFTDFDDMLKDKDIDAVHICTPHYLHLPMAEKALRAKKAVVLEKPAVMRAPELETLKAALKETGGKLCCIVQNRENPCVKKLKEIVHCKKDGDILSVSGSLYWKRTKEYYAQAAWRGKWATEGGGVVINQAVHLLDMMLFIGGGLKSISPSISNRGIPEIEVEDTADAIMEFENGTRGIFHATNLNSLNSPYHLEVTFENCVYRYGDNMLIRISKDGAEMIQRDFPANNWKSYWGMGHREAIGKFYAALSGKKCSYTTLEDVEETLKAMFKFYEKEV